MYEAEKNIREYSYSNDTGDAQATQYKEKKWAEIKRFQPTGS